MIKFGHRLPWTETPEGKFWVDQNKLAPIGSQLNSIVGTTLTATATIAPTSRIHHITGTSASIATITAPYTDFQGELIFIPDVAFVWNTSGNIGLSGTGVIGKSVVMQFDGSKWWPGVVA